MTEGEAYLAQAQSDLRLFDLLLREQWAESCHVLHYLQMACEKLAKAAFHAQTGTAPGGHVAISRISRMLARRDYANKLGFKNRHAAFDGFLGQASVLFDQIERLCPAVADSRTHARDMPNAEYPWRLPGANEWQAPCNYSFPLASDVRYGASAKQTLSFLKLLSERFHEVFYA